MSDATSGVKISPLWDLVLVRRDPPRTQTPGGLALPGGAAAIEDRAKRGHPSTVLAVGPGRWAYPDRFNKLKKPRWYGTDHVRVGMRVLLPMYIQNAVPKCDSGGEDWNLIRASDLRGEITEE